MDAPGVACRVWYAVLPLRDAVLLETEDFSPEEIAEAAQPDGVIDFQQASSTIFL